MRTVCVRLWKSVTVLLQRYAVTCAQRLLRHVPCWRHLLRMCTVCVCVWKSTTVLLQHAVEVLGVHNFSLTRHLRQHGDHGLHCKRQ
jgi:NADH:ubiquinone oxidoreductase subunit E